MEKKVLEIQKFLRNNSLEKLKTKYGIKIKNHNKYKNLYLFKYDQIHSPFSEDIVCESRGIILDSDNNWEIVSYPYKKFFNYGESNASQIDWETSKIYEKLDGSLMTLYFYDGNWHVSSSGLPDASGKVVGIDNSSKMTFCDLFWKIWKQLNYQMPTDTSKCYIFELLSPYNQIVVPQTEERIILHGTRCLRTLLELDPEPIGIQYGWQVVKTHKFDNLQSIIEASKTLDPSISEGFIVCDNNFNRIKIKGMAYIALAHTSNNLTSGNLKSNLLKIIQANEGEEVLSSFPQFKSVYDELLIEFNKLVAEIEKCYEQHKNIKNRKELAIAIKNFWYKGCIFSLVDGRVESVNDWLSMQDNKNLLSKIIN